MNPIFKQFAMSALSAGLVMPLVAHADLFTFDPMGGGHGIGNVSFIDQTPGNAKIARAGTSFLPLQYQANLISMGFNDSSTAFINGTGGNFFTFVADSRNFAMYAASALGDNLTGTGFITNKPILQAHLARTPDTFFQVVDTTPTTLDQTANGNQLGSAVSYTAGGASHTVLVIDAVDPGYFPSLRPNEGIVAEMNANVSTPFKQADPTLSWTGGFGFINGSGPNMLVEMDALMIFNAAPGVSPESALLPSANLASGWQFNFPIPAYTVFVDPLVATGYDYILDSGPNFSSVLLPSVGDGEFALYLWNGAGWMIDSTLTAGVEHSFGSLGVDRFRIAGIEASAGLDPNSPTAFVTGLNFTGPGQASMHMTPIVQEVNGVSEPGALAMVLTGLGLMGFLSSCRKTS
jgi:hypothetical protein